jgi:hypothetical protein
MQNKNSENQLELAGLGDRKLFARTDWTSACQFHDLTSEEVLTQVLARTADHFTQTSQSPRAALNKRPVILLDLDSTLYEVAPRNMRIFSEWAKAHPLPELEEIRTALVNASIGHIGFSVEDTLHALEMKHHPHWDTALTSIRKFWFERFFTNEYLQYDVAYEGAASFTQKLHEMGAEIVYLTGRDEPHMGDGTRANLVRDGFAWNVPRTRLFMKPNFHMKDLDYKREAVASLRTIGTLIASFENEPPNIVAFHKLFPEAMHVFVDTVCSETQALPCDGLYRIDSFRFKS